MIIKSNIEDNGYTGPFQRIDSLFQVIFSIESLGGWINYISFENNGSNLLVLPHTNHIKIYEIADHEKVVVGEEDIRWNGLPFLGGYINQKRQLYLGGFNKQVSKFVQKGIFLDIQGIMCLIAILISIKRQDLRARQDWLLI